MVNCKTTDYTIYLTVMIIEVFLHLSNVTDKNHIPREETTANYLMKAFPSQLIDIRSECLPRSLYLQIKKRQHISCVERQMKTMSVNCNGKTRQQHINDF